MKMFRKNGLKQALAFLFVVTLVATLFVVPALAVENELELSGAGIASDVMATQVPIASQVKPSDSQAKNEPNKWYHQWGLDEDENQVHIDSVSTDEVNGWIEKKGNDVISIIATVGKIIAVVGFFASIIFVIVGAIGNHRMMTGGFIGVAISLCAYVALTQGKDIINLFSSWVMS